jgi:SpoVK/Ycf46/Vps4 family AAA+-type ATPase
LGATNRIFDIDAAFLRRLPKRFKIDLPNEEQRLSILLKILNIQSNKFDISEMDLKEISQNTLKYSGSDLKELCRSVVMIPIQENFRSKQKSTPRSVNIEDFRAKIKDMNAQRISESMESINNMMNI